MGEATAPAPTSSSLAAEALTTVSLLVSSAGLTISLAALVFAGPFADGLARGTTVFLLGAGLSTALIAWRSSVPAVVSPVQDGPAIVLLAVIANIFADQDGVGAGEILVVLALSSLLAGVAMFVLGRFTLTRIVRFMPAVVVNAFIAGTGWLLFTGGVQVMTGETHGLRDLGGYFDDESLKFLIPGLVIGLLAYLLSAWPDAPTGAVAGSVVAATAAFYLIVAVGSSVQTVEEGGWLIGPFSSRASLSLVTPSELADAPWTDILGQTPGLLAVAAVATLSLMLNLTGLESVTRQRIDLDSELKMTGSVNVLQSVVGSIPAFPSIGFTALAVRMGVARRRVPIVIGLAMAAFGVLGVAAIGYVPRFVVGGLLVAVGLSLIVDWLVEMRESISPVDWIISLVIIVCIATIGVLEGIFLGVVIACGVFIVRYSRVDPVRRTMTGTVTRSQVDRTPAEVDRLVQEGGRTRVVELQGFLFFGSMTPVTDRVRALCDETVDHLVLDFRHVTGIDGSALRLLRALVADLAANGVSVVVSAAPAVVESGLTRHDPAPRFQATRDEALAEIEERILQGRQDVGSERLLPAEILDLFELSTLPAAKVIMTAGDDADVLLYLLRGTASAYADGNGQGRFRLRRFSGPAWIGEIGFLQRSTRSADVVSDTEVEVATITRSAFERLRADRPDVIIALLDDIALEQAKRVVTLSSALAQTAG